ncbi:hypothetical protein [Streptomyces sp. AK08-01B]|uniref:hypothetical protein n=1 Tax=Streptomyces sp. AK08-01B TaxID=3028653 RepID=UPI0029CA90EB|nr:hypothetical protein [Streptomyces sp. AK08-01B]
MTIRGESVGAAFNLFDLLEFLRCAELPETDTAIDDPELIEWRGGGPEMWSALELLADAELPGLGRDADELGWSVAVSLDDGALPAAFSRPG